jgi:hypothetical protein
MDDVKMSLKDLTQEQLIVLGLAAILRIEEKLEYITSEIKKDLDKEK